ncbi:adenylate/guanylate cyclase domain-containing protein [Bradyrhizobium sp. 197]|uniref:adenylate/guanylate cyclase domain-containing protein n=1 Tax=Bradyrhizobium sp. 197 TaxID=2782663 RepID=UPI0031F6C940
MRLKAAIESLSPDEPSTQPTSAPARQTKLEPREAERRQLTLMFCDLVGSTTLSTRLDAEDYRDLIRTYHDACAGVVARFDGFIAKFMGDGVPVYFGWPRRAEHRAGGVALRR